MQSVDAPDRSVELVDSATRSAATSRLIIEIAAAASGELDLDQILHEALGRLRTVVRLTGGSIALIDGDDLVIRAAIGPFADEALGQRLTRGPSRSWAVVERLESYLSGDLFRECLGMHPAHRPTADHAPSGSTDGWASARTTSGAVGAWDVGWRRGIRPSWAFARRPDVRSCSRCTNGA